MKALLVGGSKDLSESISVILKVRWPGLNLVHTTQPGESMGLIVREQPDIVILHLDPLCLECFDIIGEIRSFAGMPIVILSDEDDAIDKIRALEMGADDWIAASSIPMEFIAKVNAVLRRCQPSSNNRISSFLNGKVTIDYVAREVRVLGKEVKLTPIEHKILCQLVRSAGSVVSYADLRHNVWGPDYRAGPEFLKKYIYRLRCKLEEDPPNPKIILTRRGVGYLFSRSCDRKA